MVVCPSCGSSRIRSDYKPAPFFLRLIGVRGLLCDNCNFPFRAFSMLPPRSRRPHHAQRKADIFNPAPVPALVSDPALVRQNSAAEKTASGLTPPVEKPEPRLQPAAERLNLGLAQPATDKADFAISSAPSSLRVVTDHIAPVRNDLRTQITRIHAQGARRADAPSEVQPPSPAPSTPPQICPECNSRRIKRRRRNFIERSLLSFSEHKAYTCRDCGASFYARREERESWKASANPSAAAALESSRFKVEPKG